ncbi:MAG: hypothetical protein KKB30_14245 [Proteobacteria bacterium]|nr:hypothetical protein [Pseudomonadota bacterium]
MGPQDPNLTSNLVSEIEDAVDDLFGQYEAKAPKLNTRVNVAAPSQPSAPTPVAAVEPPAAVTPPAAVAPPVQPPQEAKPLSPPEPELTLDLQMEVSDPAPSSAKPVAPRPPADPVEHTISFDLDLDLTEPKVTPPVTAPLTQQAQPTMTLDLDFDDAVTASVKPGDMVIFDQMDEAMLTVDWEINDNTINTARQQLQQISISFPHLSQGTAGQIINMMMDVFKSIGESPLNSPTSAPKHLKEAIQVLKEAALLPGAPNSALAQKLNIALDSLKKALPHLPSEDGVLDLGLDDLPTPTLTPEVSSSPIAPQPPTPISVTSELAGILNSYATTIDQCIKRITPMETLFAKTKGMGKLHSIINTIKQQLTTQAALLQNTFSANYRQAFFPGGQMDPLTEFIKSQAVIMEQCSKKITPLEKLFAKTSGYEKLLTLTNKIRTSIDSQHDILSRAIFGDYRPAAAPVAAAPVAAALVAAAPVVAAPVVAAPVVAAPVAVAPIAATAGKRDDNLTDLFQSSIDELSKCVKVVLPLEMFSGPASELEDLQIIGQELREKLETLKRAFNRAIHGDYRPIHNKNQSAANGTGTANPWPKLLTATWQGQTVAIIPEQIAYESKKPVPIKKIKSLSFFPLKSLKTSPWTNLSALFRGELASFNKKGIKEIELPIITHPVTANTAGNNKKSTIVVLFNQGRGKVVLLDNHTKELSDAENGTWFPATDPDSAFAGELKIFGNTIPVIAI